jgi:hypothetical protein
MVLCRFSFGDDELGDTERTTGPNRTEGKGYTKAMPDGGRVRPDDAPELEDIGLRDEVDETRLVAALKFH